MGIRTSDVNKIKEAHFIMISGSVYQEEIITLDLNVTNITSPKYMKQKLIQSKGEIDKSLIIVGDFNTYFSNRWKKRISGKI